MAAVRAALEADTANAAATVRWAPIRGDVSSDGRHGYTFGFLDMLGGSASRNSWKYLAYWRRNDSGHWQVIAHKRLPREAGAHEHQPPEGFETPRDKVSPRFPGGGATRGQLMAWDSAFAKAAQQGVERAFLDYTATDGATLSGGPNFAWGREKVAAEFASFAPGSIDWAPDVAEVAAGGDLAFATGEVVIKEKQADGSFVEVGRGRYLTIWKRRADGAWKLVIDG